MRARVWLVMLVSVLACDESTGVNLSDVPGYLISAVHVTPSIDTIHVLDPIRPADQVIFTAEAIGRSGTTLPSMTFAWSTSDPSIATIDDEGVVTPKATGVVEIAASADKIGRAMLVILPATLVVTVSPAIDTIHVNLPIVADRDTVRIQASARELGGAPLSGLTFTWSSSAPSVVTVDETGLVHAKSVGTATVIASTNGHAAAAVIRVIAGASGSG